MSSFQSTITTLGNTASFYDWFNQYNNSVVSKLNLAQIARPLAGDGITFTSATNGGYTFEISNTITKNMIFGGDVTINGVASFAGTDISSILVGVTGNFLSEGITVGKVVRITDVGGLTLAVASSATGAEAMGIAVSVNPTKTTVAVAGKISGSTIVNNLISGGFNTGCVYFLNPSITGGLTSIEPTSLGLVSKPMILGLGVNEGLILPYRGQFINGICGSSGNNVFNSALFITVESGGEPEANFGLRPGNIIALSDFQSNSGSGVTFYQSTTTSSSYYKANNKSNIQSIIGIATEYVGSYSATPTDPVTIKVNTIGSVVTDISSYSTNWNKVSSSPIVYLDDTGNPTESSAFLPKLIIGTIADGHLVFNPYLPPTFTGFVTSGTNSTAFKNILINGSLSLWQRARGITSGYGISAGAGGNKKYLADKWVMWGTSGEAGFTGQRQNFDLIQTEVAGYPKYYVQLKKNTTPSNGPAYFYNLIDDVRTIANKQLTFSFYARTLGSTATFAIHGIQNISVGAGNTYINGITYDVRTTPDTNWNRYVTSFTAPPALSGITSSYSLLGIRLDQSGKTYEFAQFMLEEGFTASTPQKVDMDEEYSRMAKYYQRSYAPDEVTSVTTLNVNNAVTTNLIPPNKIARYTFPIRFNKAPTITIYSIDGTRDSVSILLAGIYYDITVPFVVNSGGYGECVRRPIPETLPSILSTLGASNTDLYFSFTWPIVCDFDDIAFHYVADADTTLN